MNLSRARILQAQRTAIQTTLAKIPYYKFSYVLKPLESLVKRYTYIKHTHQIQGVCFTYVPTTIYEDAPFHHKLISTGYNLFNFCQIDVLIFISLITGNIMPISFFFFFFANNRFSVGISKYICIKVVITQPWFFGTEQSRKAPAVLCR